MGQSLGTVTNDNIALEMRETRPGGVHWLRPGREAPWGREGSPSRAPALCHMLHVHSGGDDSTHFTDVGTEAQLVKPLPQDQEAKAFRVRPTFRPPLPALLPPLSTAATLPPAAPCGKQHLPPAPFHLWALFLLPLCWEGTALTLPMASSSLAQSSPSRPWPPLHPVAPSPPRGPSGALLSSQHKGQ